MKILFVHEVSWQKKVTYEIHDFPELLARKGHAVSFIEFDEDEGEPELLTCDLRNYLFSRRGWVSRTSADSTIFLVSPKRVLPRILGRLLAIFFHPILITGYLLRNRPDVVVLYSVPTNGWQTVSLCKLLRIPVVFRAIDVSHQIRETYFHKLIKSVEKFVYRHVDAVSTHNQSLADYISQMSDGRTLPEVLLPGVDLERFRYRQKSIELMHRYNIRQHDKVILFMGTLFRFSGLRELFQDSSRYLRDNSDMKFLVVGSGEHIESLVLLTRELHIDDHVIFTGKIDYLELPQHLNLGDVSILPFTDNLVTQLALPGKVLQYLSSGLPCVAFPLLGLRSMFNEDCGIVYVSTPNEMFSACCDILTNNELRQSLALQARSAVEQRCNWDQQVTSFEALLRRTIG